MNRHVLLGAVFGIVALPGLAGAVSLPYYVSESYMVEASAAPLGSDDHNHLAKQLQQTTISEAINASASDTETTHTFADGHTVVTPYIVQGASSLSDTTTIGAIHAVAASSSDTGGYPYTASFGGVAGGSVNSVFTWEDTVTFSTSNPNGSDFTATLVLDDTIAISANFGPTNANSGKFDATVQGRIYLGNLGSPAMQITDAKNVQQTGSVLTPPPSDTESVTFHVSDGEQLSMSGELSVVTEALNAQGSVTADASDTAEFQLVTSDPLASYSTASGTVFATPEPGTLGLLGVAVMGCVLRRRFK